MSVKFVRKIFFWQCLATAGLDKQQHFDGKSDGDFPSENRLSFPDQLDKKLVHNRVGVRPKLLQSVSEQYKQELTSRAFASNLDSLVEQADYWVHGHTHDSFDCMLGKCRVLCNPRGYPINRITGEYENPKHDSQLIVEVP